MQYLCRSSGLLKFFLLVGSIRFSHEAVPCHKRQFDSTSFVCVCNRTYCDEEDEVVALPRGQVLHVLSDAADHRFSKSSLDFQPLDGPVPGTVLQVDEFQTFQSVLGWGGSFTDAAAINIAKLEPQMQDMVVRSYYDQTGLDYNTGRLNIGGCDFSTRTYTYLDTVGDTTLTTFQLQEEDLVYKIPLIKKAQSFRSEEIKLTGSPWTAPIWMKSNNDYIGQGYLLPEYYQLWAEYFVRFLQEYEGNGVRFWGLTPQNEPEDGNVPNFSFNCMGWNSTTQRIFVAENLGPALEEAGYGDVKLMIHDDQRIVAPKWVREVLSDPIAFQYVDGVAVHWYTDDTIGLPHALDMVHEEFPDKFILYTEACNGDKPFEEAVVLGSWYRGEKYIRNIIEDLNHWVVGWTDWNLALDMEGGPNWALNFVDAPIIVNPEANEFYKQPMYYAYGHVSRFFNPGSVRIQVDAMNDTKLEFAGVKRPDGGIAIAMLNSQDVSETISIMDPSEGVVTLTVGPKSMHTFAYWK